MGVEEGEEGEGVKLTEGREPKFGTGN